MQTPTEFFPSSTNANIHRQWLSSPPQLEICHWHDPINALLLPPPVFNKIVSATSATQHNYGLALAVEGKSTDPARTLDEILFHQNFSPVFLHSPDCESCSVHFWALFSLSVRHPRRHDRHILHMTLIFFSNVCIHFFVYLLWKGSCLTLISHRSHVEVPRHMHVSATPSSVPSFWPLAAELVLISHKKASSLSCPTF